MPAANHRMTERMQRGTVEGHSKLIDVTLNNRTNIRTCRSAVNRCFLSCAAASRTRSNPMGKLPWLGVQRLSCLGGFPLARPLSAASAAWRSALFGTFSATMDRSDFPRSFIIGVRP
jgi:hypothetical protein